MPLPTGGGPWPPEEARADLARIARLAAWYSDDPSQISLSYSTLTPEQASAADHSRRRFWSRRSRDLSGRPRAAIHLPVASDVASTAADLLFGNPPSLRVDVDVPATDYLQEVEADGLTNTLLEGAEIASALGGVYLRASWDKEVAERPFVVVVPPDAAIPEWRFGRLIAVTFWSDVDVSRGILRHLERHDLRSGLWHVEHGLYDGQIGSLGVRRPLSAHPSTSALADDWDSGSPILGVAYVPNMRPNRIDRTSPVGRADVDGAETLLDAADETMTSWIRDIRLGRARLVVPETYLDTQGPGRGQTFDEDREVFTAIAVPVSPTSGVEITESQFEIRTAEHQATVLDLVEAIVRHAGYSPQDFGLHIEGRAESGTALRIRRGRSLATTAKKQRYWQPALQRILRSVLYLGGAVYSAGVSDPGAVTVEWRDEIDLPEAAATVELVSRAQAASTEIKVRWLHPDWTDVDVADEVTRIQQETGLLAPDAAALGAVP